MAIPTSLDPAVVEHFRGRDEKGQPLQDSVLDALAAALGIAQATAQQIEASAKLIAADVTSTPIGNALRTKNLAAQLGEKAARSLDAARAKALAEIDKIEAKMQLPPVAPALGSEIRSALRRMPAGVRAKRLSEAIAAGDEQTISAALAGPLWLAGLEPAEAALRAVAWRKKRFPAEVDRQARLQKSVAALDRGGASLVQFVKDAAGSSSANVVLAEAAAARAKEAEAAAKVITESEEAA